MDDALSSLLFLPTFFRPSSDPFSCAHHRQLTDQCERGITPRRGILSRETTAHPECWTRAAPIPGQKDPIPSRQGGAARGFPVYAQTDGRGRMPPPHEQTRENVMAINTTAPNDQVNATPRVRPMTGEEYLESLRDGREIWIYGERVKDVTTHPGVPQHRPDDRAPLRRAARSRAPGRADDPDRHRQRRLHTRFFKATRNRPRSWSAPATRSPSGRASPTAGSAAAPTTRRRSSPRSAPTPDFYEPYEENARRWYKKVQEEVSFVNHAIVNPPVDRDKPLDEVKDVYMHVEKETDAGLIVSGAKVVATTSSADASTTSSPTTARCRSRPRSSRSSASCRPTRRA